MQPTNIQPRTNLACRFRQASKVIALLIAALGVVVLCGWAFNVSTLTAIRPAFHSMKANTALSFFLLAAGLWLAHDEKRQRIRRILGLCVVIIAGATLAEYAFHLSLGIDQLLFRDTRTPTLTAYPGRMAIATAICFVLLGLAVTLLGTKKAIALQHALVAACFALSLVALCGYLYGIESLYSITSFSTVAVHTAAGFLAACLAYFLACPDEGLVSIAASNSNSGVLLRALVPAIIVVPILIGWLRLAGQRAHLYETPFGIALQVLGGIACLTALTLLIVRSMHRLELEHSRDEEAVKESESRFRLVADTAPVMIWMSGLDKKPTYFNQRWLDFTGFSETDLQNRLAEIVHPDDYQQCHEVYCRGFDQRQPFRKECRLRRHDGQYRWMLDIGVPRFHKDGSLTGYIGSCVDVTEGKLAEAALLELNHALEAQTALLRSREELLKIFVKHVPAAVAMLDRDMRYLQVSDRWCGDFSLDSSGLLGRSHYEIFPDIPERWKQLHRRALNGETLRSDEDRWDRKDGTTWLRWELRPWHNIEGSPGGILIFSEDITRRKQMEEMLSGMSRKLIEAHEQERSRIGRELHDDISQRLAMLSVGLGRLQDDPSDIQNHLQELQKQTTELSNDVQALSHELHSSKLEYLGVVSGIRSWCKEFGERQGMEIDFKSDVSSVVPFDIGISLFRVLQEALQNAAKHSGVKRIEAQLHEESGAVHLTIRDLGKGFEIEAARQGRGLGLTSMQERVRLVNGTITIESKPMGGTTIHVRVPFGSEQASQQAAG